MVRFLAILMAFVFTGCESSRSNHKQNDNKADYWVSFNNGSDEEINNPVETDTSADSGDTTDGSTVGCIPPPQYYTGKEYTCADKTGTQMLVATRDGWNMSRAPYGDVIAVEGMPCDPTEALAYFECTEYVSATGCIPPPQYYPGKEYTCNNYDGKQMLIRTIDGWNMSRAPYDGIPDNLGLPCDPTFYLDYHKCIEN